MKKIKEFRKILFLILCFNMIFLPLVSAGITAEEITKTETASETKKAEGDLEIIEANEILGSSEQDLDKETFQFDENGKVTGQVAESDGLNPEDSKLSSRALTGPIGFGYLDVSMYSTSSTLNVYTSATSSVVYTYFNTGSSNRIPCFRESNGRVQVSVNGYLGWINKPTSANFIPLSAAGSFKESYSVNSSGALVFSYRYYNKDTTIIVGQAPSFLSQNVQYFSLDGIYFYTDRYSMFTDAGTSNHPYSINKNAPYYNYYQYLPFRTKTKITKEDVLKFLNSKGINSNNSVLANDTAIKAFYEAQDLWNVNAALDLSVGMLESGYGQSNIAKTKNNLFGWGAVDSGPYQGAYTFSSVAEGIKYHMKNGVSDGYLDNYSDSRFYGGTVGNKNQGMNVKYASDPYWGSKISGIYYMLDKSAGFKDLNAYRIGIIQDSAPRNVKYNGSTVYTTNNRKTKIEISKQSFIVLNNSSSEITTVSNVGICNSGDLVQRYYINQSTAKFVIENKSCSLNTPYPYAQHKESTDRVVLSSNNMIFIGNGSNTVTPPPVVVTPPVTPVTPPTPVMSNEISIGNPALVKSSVSKTIYDDTLTRKISTLSKNNRAVIVAYKTKDNVIYYKVLDRVTNGKPVYGWVTKDYLKLQSGSITYVNSGVNIRSAARNSSTRICTTTERIPYIYSGTRSGQKISGSRTWVKIITGGKIRYVSKVYTVTTKANRSVIGL